MAGQAKRQAKSAVRKAAKQEQKAKNRSAYAKKHPQAVAKAVKKSGPRSSDHNMGGKVRTNATKGLWRGGPDSITTKTYHECKVDGVKQRKVWREGLTAEEQLKELDHRLGVGVGAKKERARLTKQILTATLKVTTDSQAKEALSKFIQG